jgi:6-phosphofructokinase 1
MFFIEVMGADAGFIALHSGIACGAEAIMIPELKGQTANLRKTLEEGFKRKKSSNIIIVAEGEDEGGAFEIADKVKKDFEGYDTRVTVLGHIQRGGSPTAHDRVSASRLGYAAVEALLDGQKSSMVGLQNNAIVLVPFRKAIKLHKDINREMLEISDILSI